MSYLLDINVLMDATNQHSARHESVRAWLDDALIGPPRSVGIPWHSILGFVRITSDPRVFSPPAAVSSAWVRVERWLDTAAAWVPCPTERHRAVLGDLVRSHELTSSLVSDTHLAALAVEHGLTMASADKGFKRFVESAHLRWIDPSA